MSWACEARMGECIEVVNVCAWMPAGFWWQAAPVANGVFKVKLCQDVSKSLSAGKSPATLQSCHASGKNRCAFAH